MTSTVYSVRHTVYGTHGVAGPVANRVESMGQQRRWERVRQRMKLGQQSNGVIEHTYLYVLDALALAQHLILKARRKGHHAGFGLVRGEVRLTRGVTGARHSQQREKKESGEEGGVFKLWWRSGEFKTHADAPAARTSAHLFRALRLPTLSPSIGSVE